MSDHKPDHRGLSPSSLALFMSCNRKYFYKKVVKLPIDTDQSEDLESFQVGKCFHRALELSRHELEGYTYSMLAELIDEYELTRLVHQPMIFAMLGAYRDMHKRAGLKAVACEIIVETDAFYGIVDVILKDAQGNWWIGDMKTAATFRENDVPALPRHPQLNLYAYHAKEIAAIVELPVEKFMGCRYRMTTKSKLIQKKKEELRDYIARLSDAIVSYDFLLPKEIMAPSEIYDLHAGVVDFIENRKENALTMDWRQNMGSCMNYFRPCEFWSRCHGKNHSEMMELEVVTNG